MKRKATLLAMLLSALLLAATSAEAKRQHHKSKPTAPQPSPADSELGSKTVHYGEKDVIKLKTKVRFLSTIVLPPSEEILEVTCGDKDFWVVSGNQNFAYVKPAKEGSTTNLNIVTAAGNIYSFVLVEISNLPDTEPDLKVFVEPKEQSMVTPADQSPRFVSSREIDKCTQQIESDRKQLEQIERKAQIEEDQSRDKILSEIRFNYRFDRDKAPFHIKAIYHDSKFTYLQGQPEEIPTLYEIRDGKPNLVNFEYKNGIYVVEKVIDRGYLAIGKKRLLFARYE